MIDLSPLKPTLAGKSLAVMGLGASGLAVVRASLAASIPVLAWDDDEDARLEAQNLGAECRDLSGVALKAAALLVLAPGIPLTHPTPHPVVKNAQALGLPIIGDIELFQRAFPAAKTIGITGTNGKSTTTALTAHILNACGVKAYACGNIGAPVFDLPQEQDSVYVIELSSFQIDLCPSFRPDTAAIINISPDHIDRHGTMENYVSIKARLTETSGNVVIGVDDAWCQSIHAARRQKSPRSTFSVSVKTPVAQGVFVGDGVLYDAMEEPGGAAPVMPLSAAGRLPGLHNAQNIGFAYALARLAGIADRQRLAAAIADFPGLAHRQYLVRTIGKTDYINDSKATNADATAMALCCYGDIYWIAGGVPKDGGLSGLEPFMASVRHAFLIGQAAEDFAGWLQGNAVPFTLCRTLDHAVREASAMARTNAARSGAGNTVLLSPACASYDQFDNFEHRGREFIRLVEGLDASDNNCTGGRDSGGGREEKCA